MVLYVKPRESLQIFDPVLRDVIPVAGRLVDESDYWHRRIADGDVTHDQKAADAAVKAAAAEREAQAKEQAKGAEKPKS